MKFWREHVRPTFSKLSDKLLEKLSRKDYRDMYMDEQVRAWIARQIRVLREQRGWSQTEFAKVCGKPQSVISRLEDPDYGKVSLQTLLDIRAAFDVGLEVRFVDFATAVANARDLSTGAMQVDKFDIAQLNEALRDGTPEAGNIIARALIEAEKRGAEKERERCIRICREDDSVAGVRIISEIEEPST